MIVGIDHIVIRVDDMEKASADYRELGFHVVPGGEHTGGLSHNALICFQDGSYLELIAFKGPVPQNHLFYRQHGKEGFVTYALLPEDTERDIEAARERGLEYDGPRSGGRQRPDGQRVEWQIATPRTLDLPFLCGDVTPRELRVPTGDARQHPNGATGIAEIVVLVEDLPASLEHYGTLLGKEPEGDFDETGESNQHIATFRIGDSTIMLMQPTWGELPTYLKEHGEGLYMLTLRATANRTKHVFDLVRTHGALIETERET
jgi:catechol 2,3-dioxygenase-like lactoylglutathione lyase family enzyme